MYSYFKNIEAKKEYIELYYKKLRELNITYEFLTVETSFGETNIIATGNLNNPPLVLVHGENSCAPLAMEALKGLQSKFRIYAIDVLGQPNLSEEVRLNLKTSEYGKWMYEIMSRLQISRACLVGISFGSFICLKVLVYESKQISKVFLIEPLGIVKVNRIKSQLKEVLPIKLYKWREKGIYCQHYLNAVFSYKDNFIFAFLPKLILTYKMTYSITPLLKNYEVNTISKPLYIIASEKDLLFSKSKLVKRVKRIFPAITKIFILKKEKPVSSDTDTHKIIEIILNATLNKQN